jgi:non-specific serine/threonine protein kinase
MTKKTATGPRYYFLDGFEFIPDLGIINYNGEPFDGLLAKDLDVLRVLLEAGEKGLTEEEIVERAWPGVTILPGNGRSRVSHLRKALTQAFIKCVKSRYSVAIDYTRVEDDPPGIEIDTPHYPDPLIGRNAEIATGKELIADNRLIVITGGGGMGKTRVAVELGRRLAEGFPGGVRLVDVATLRNPAELTGAVATVLGVSLEGSESPIRTIAKAIGSQRMLLIPDSCEYLPACGPFFEELLSLAPNLRVLATSQQRLGVATEKIWPIDELAVPPEAWTRAVEGSARRIAGFGAAQLFVARAESADYRFRLDDRNAPAVAI